MPHKRDCEKLLSAYEPRTYRRPPRNHGTVTPSIPALRRPGSLFRVDLAKVLEKKDYFVFSGFLDKFIR